MAVRRASDDVRNAERIATIRTLLRGGEVARALQVVGDRWSHLVLRDAFLGVRRFEDLRRRTGATRGTLTARLNALVDAGLLYRAPCGDAPSRREYRLTEKGLAFYPVAISMWRWERRWSHGGTLPPRLVHAACGHALDPRLVCGHCRQPIHRSEIGYRAGPGVRRYATARATTRRRDSRPSGGDDVDTTLFHCVDTVGDRWMALLLGALFLGLHRYDDIVAALGISTNILADRLRRLLAAGVLEQRLYRDNPPRHEYHLTEKGWDLLGFALAMHDWGTRWLPAPHGPALVLRHLPCDHRLRSTLACGSCGHAVDPRDERIRAAAGRRGGAHG